MTHGGYRGDRDEWPPQRPRQASPDDRYDTDPGTGGWPPAAAHSEADEPRTAVPYAGGGSWPGQQPGASPYDRPEPTYERYPDAYVVEADGLAPAPSRRLGAEVPPTAAPARPDPRREAPHGRLADLRPFAPDGRLRRFAPDGSPLPGQPGAGGSQPGAGVGPDVRRTGQMPIFGPGTPISRPDQPATGEQRRPEYEPRPAGSPGSFRPSPVGSPRPVGSPPGWQPAGAQPAGPQSAGPPPLTFPPGSPATGSQPRYYDADSRMTGSQPRFYDADPGTTGSQTRFYDADPRTTGSQTRFYDADPRATGSQTRIADGGARVAGGLPPVANDQAPRRRGRLIVAVLAAIVVLVGLGFTGVTLLRHHGSTGANATGVKPGPSINTAAISDRTVDPALLTTAEVFGAATIPSTTSGGSYRVVRSEADASCGTAATAAISTLLASQGCNQAIRATMLSSDQAYVVTAGVLNLPNTASATKVASSLQSAIAKGTGRLNGLDAGSPTTVITSAQAQVAWDTRGHYVVYSIIALTSGKAIAASDKQVPVIINDVVENYLGDKVLGARAQRSAAPTPASS
jgi:hypothetical protein